MNTQLAIVLIAAKKQGKVTPIKYLTERNLIDYNLITKLEDNDLALTYYKEEDRCIILTLKGYKALCNQAV